MPIITDWISVVYPLMVIAVCVNNPNDYIFKLPNRVVSKEVQKAQIWERHILPELLADFFSCLLSCLVRLLFLPLL